MSAAPAPQVWLCHHAEVTQQDDGRETVGAALDQELPVWGAVAENTPQLSLSRLGASSPVVTPRPHTELRVGLCVHPSKGHSPYAPVQVGDVVLSFPFRPMGAEGGPNKVLLSSRPSYHHGPHHFCPAGEALCPQVCRRRLPSPRPLFWFLAAFALGPQGSCLQSSHSICPCSHWQPGPGLMELGDWFCFPRHPVEQRVQGRGTQGPAWGGLCSSL